MCIKELFSFDLHACARWGLQGLLVLSQMFLIFVRTLEENEVKGFLSLAGYLVPPVIPLCWFLCQSKIKEHERQNMCMLMSPK